DLVTGEIRAKREPLEEAARAIRRQNVRELLRMVVAKTVRNTVPPGYLAGPLRGAKQLVLKSRVGDLHQCRGDLFIRAASQVGDPVLGDDEIAEVPRDRGAAVARQNVRADLAAGPLLARAPNEEDRATVLEGVRHGHEVVLAADTAHHTA